MLPPLAQSPSQAAAATSQLSIWKRSVRFPGTFVYISQVDMFTLNRLLQLKRPINQKNKVEIARLRTSRMWGDQTIVDAVESCFLEIRSPVILEPCEQKKVGALRLSSLAGRDKGRHMMLQALQESCRDRSDLYCMVDV